MTIIKSCDLEIGEIYYSKAFNHSYDNSLMKEQGPFLVLEVLITQTRLVTFLSKKGIECRNFNEERKFVKLT